MSNLESWYNDPYLFDYVCVSKYLKLYYFQTVDKSNHDFISRIDPEIEFARAKRCYEESLEDSDNEEEEEERPRQRRRTNADVPMPATAKVASLAVATSAVAPSARTAAVLPPTAMASTKTTTATAARVSVLDGLSPPLNAPRGHEGRGQRGRGRGRRACGGCNGQQ